MDAFTSWLSENGLAIIGMLIAAVTVRGIVNFDVNQWLNDRRKRREDNLRMLCPHVAVVKHQGELKVRSLFVSPHSTLDYRCQNCGMIVNDPTFVEQSAQYWVDNFDAFMERQKQMEKLAKKLGR